MGSRGFWLVLAGTVGLRALTLPVLPVLDPSEARYAVVARDMLATSDFVTPMIWANGEYVPFFSKPPLLFWLQAGAMQVGGVNEMSARVPAFLAALAVLAVVGTLALRVFSRDVVRSALLILVSSPLFFLCAGLGLTDMLLCLMVAGALFSHLAFTREENPVRARRYSLLTFTFLGLGMVSKGPIALVEFGLPVFLWTAWTRRPTDFTGQAWWPGVLLFVAPWAPWYVWAEARNPGFLEYFFVNENVLRFAASEYGDRYGGGHKHPPGMALVFFALAMLPWIGVLGWRLRSATARAAFREKIARPEVQLLGFVVVVPLVFLSFSRHILGTYVLPLLPAASILIAIGLVTAGLGARTQRRLAVGLTLAYALVVVGALPVVQGRWSAEGLLSAARSYQDSRGADGRLVFVEKRPFSARFYEGGTVVDQIPYDAGQEHFRWYLEPANGHLLILREHHSGLLDAYVTDRLRKVSTVGRFSIWEPVEPEARTASR